MTDHISKPNVAFLDGMKILRFSNPEIQSAMSLINPDALELEYTRLMMGFLLFVDNPHHIAMVGLGGGSLVKYCYKNLINTYLTVAEISPEVIALRDEFNIPPDDSRLQIIPMNGVDLMRQPSMYDVILVDGFDTTGIPYDLTTENFFSSCYDSLDNQGVLVMNLHLDEQGEDCKRAIRYIFQDQVVEVIDSEDCNCIIFAIKSEHWQDQPFGSLTKPAVLSKEAWRQIMPEMKRITQALTNSN